MDYTGEKLLRIEYVPLDQVARWDRNPKRHDLPRLINSIKRYGFRDAVIYDGTLAALVAGHGRAAALEAMRETGEPVPDGVATDAAGTWYLPVQFGNDAPSRAVAEAFALDHNNLTLGGSGLDPASLWEPAGYGDVLRSLADGFALPVTVSEAEAAGLLGLNGAGADVEPQIDRAAELAEVWGTAVGQVWEIGEHRLAVGDCTDPAVVEAVMRGERADVVATDPPYSSGGLHAGARRAPTNKKYKQTRSKRNYSNFSGDNRDQHSFLRWVTLWLSSYREVSSASAYLFVFSDWRQVPVMADAIQMAGWMWRGVNVWDKTEGSRMASQAYFRAQAEFAIWGTNGELTPVYEAGGATYPGVFRRAIDSDKLHLTQKPVEVIEWLLGITAKGGCVVDPFVGSGTTLIAAHNLNRRARCIEIDPGYAAVTLQRAADIGLEPRRCG